MNNRLTVFPATNPDGTAVILCPGGSYCWLDYKGEGLSTARWLQRNGITAFILRYRVATWWGWFSHYRLFLRGNRYPDPQNDLIDAMRWVQDHVEDYHVDPTRIGLMGFSAGGHLVMSSVTDVHTAERLPYKPAFIASIYPVVTFVESCMHKRSRRGLIGEGAFLKNRLCDQLSLERHVPADCPTVFLVNCKDDPIVDFHNSELLASALMAQGVHYEYHQYATGGHGFGADPNKGTQESRRWTEDFLSFYSTLFPNTP